MEREQKFYDLYNTQIQYEVNRIKYETYYNPLEFNELYQKKNIDITFRNIFDKMYDYFYDSFDTDSEDESEDESDYEDIVVSKSLSIDFSNNKI